MEIPILAIAMAALAGMERLPALRFQPSRFFRPYFITDLVYLGSGGLLLALLVRALVLRLETQAGLPQPMAHSGIPLPLLTLLAIVAYDFAGFVSHRLLHRVEPLWELHKVHHSSRTLDWLATFRAHVLEHLLRHVLSVAVLLLLGFPVAVVGLAGATYSAWAAFGHSNFRPELRFLEPLLITPRLHRLHHAPETGSRNLGTIFSIWDRLAGNLLLRPTPAPERIGVPGELDTYPQSWIPQLIHPLREIVRRAEAPEIEPARWKQSS
jgi:lathosterol oxidase